MPLKVCLYVSTFNPGGAERQIVNLARELSSRGHDVVLLHMQKDIKQAHYLDALRGTRVQLVDAAMPNFLKEGILLSRKQPDFYANIPASRFVKTNIRFLAGAFSELKPDIVHSYLDLPNCTAGCAAIMAHVPVHLASFRNVDPETGKFGWADLTLPLYRYILDNGQPHFEANSKTGLDHYAHWLDVDPGRIRYTPNGIDPGVYMSPRGPAPQEMRQALGIPASSPLLMTLARFSPEKAPQTMLDIFARIQAVHPEARYVIAGHGMSAEGEMGAMVRARGLERAVHLLGVRSDVAELLSCADVFLLPSKIEGFPNAIMEAMSAGVPVVASKVGGVPDLIRHGQDGFLHEAQDLDAMVRSVATLLDEPGVRARFGASARHRIAQEFSLQKLGDRVLASYEELLDKSSA